MPGFGFLAGRRILKILIPLIVVVGFIGVSPFINAFTLFERVERGLTANGNFYFGDVVVVKPGANDFDIAFQGYFRKEKFVRVESTCVSAFSLKKILQSEHLLALALTGPEVDDEVIASVRNDSKLVELRVSSAIVTDSCTKDIARLRDLEALELTFSTDFHGESLGVLMALPIRSLELSGCPLHEQSLIEISKISNLEYLSLHKTGLKGKNLISLKNLKKLEVLVLPGGVTNENLRGLENNESIRTLTCWSINDVTVNGLEALVKTLPNIEDLSVPLIRLSKQEKELLQRAASNDLKIYCRK